MTLHVCEWWKSPELTSLCSHFLMTLEFKIVSP